MNSTLQQYLVTEKQQIENPTFVKWAGGKTQLLEQFSELYPQKFNRFFEIFLGSGAVFFNIKQKFSPSQSFLFDINEDLINTFKLVRDHVEELIPLLREHRDKDNNREYFNKQREQFNTMKSGLEKAAIFIYLNKTCFNGLYRVNSEGKFNVPFGKYKKPAILQETKLRMASKLLQNSELLVANFAEAMKRAKENDFVYMDPPYFPLTKTASFTSYQKDSFLEEEQRQLVKEFQQLDKRGCLLMLSNSDTQFIRELYEGYKIHTVKARRAINRIGTKRGKINEIVITNY
ncbi:DNA adenine methylase [Candidatus Woesearchaeota archaeon]|nr:DNA adenine methylase [Candidatus Woesearchaeota archaeon]